MVRTSMAAWMAAALAGGSATAETFYSKDGVVFEGTLRQVVSGAAACNVLEQHEVNYEELKANQGRPLHLWQVDYTVRNESGRELEYPGVAARERPSRPTPPVRDALLLAVASQQPRQLRRRQAGGPAQVAPQQTPLGLGQGLVAEPPNGLLNVPVERLAVRESDFRLGAAGQEPLDLVQALERFQLELQNHPPMVRTPPRASCSCSSLILDKTGLLRSVRL